MVVDHVLTGMLFSGAGNVVARCERILFFFKAANYASIFLTSNKGDFMQNFFKSESLKPFEI